MSTDLDPLDLNAQEEAKAEQAKADRLLQQIADDDFKWLMSEKRGRRFVYGLLDFTGVFRNPYVWDDPNGTGFRCGEMNVGQRYLGRIHELCPQLFHTMIKEQEDDRRKRSKPDR